MGAPIDGSDDDPRFLPGGCYGPKDPYRTPTKAPSRYPLSSVQVPKFDPDEACRKCGCRVSKVDLRRGTTARDAQLAATATASAGAMFNASLLAEAQISINPYDRELLAVTCEHCKWQRFRKPLDWNATEHDSGEDREP